MNFFIAGSITFLGSLVQGAVGFAYGLISVPLLTWAGFDLSQAVALTTLSIGIQVAISSYKLRAHIPFKDVKLAAFIRYMTMPIGIIILLTVENFNRSQVKRIVGVIVLLSVLIRIFARVKPMSRIPTIVSIATFSISGILQGAVSMGGPPIVLWMTARDFTSQTARAFTLTLFLLNAPVQVLLLYWLSDNMNNSVILMAFLLSPIIFIGSLLGIRIGNQFSKDTLNKAAIILLLVISASAILTA